jgi:ABC-type multidrug transport system permease subunit
VVFEDPVYGTNRASFTEFMAPGVILSITYFMAVGLTALSFIIERKEGLLDRSWIAGVTATEVMFAHVVAQFAVLVVQVRQNRVVKQLRAILNFTPSPQG